MELAVRFENISVTLPGPNGLHTILQNISGAVQKGQIVTLVGPSGSGKSTLLSVCNLFLTPTEGQVYVMDKEVRKWKVTDLRQTTGMVLQNPTMFPGTVQDNIRLAASINGFPLESPEEYLQQVGLPNDLLKKPANDLSGGQKQRVALARMLVNKPSILLLDEVTSALDPTSTKEIEDLIQNIKQVQGTTIIWVTHNLEQARRVGTQTWLMVGGKVIEAADTNDFFENPTEEMTRQFLQGEL